MKKLIALLSLFVPSLSLGVVHIGQGDRATLATVTAASFTVTGAGIRFPDGTVQVSSPPAGGASVTVISSGVPFGSSSNAVTQDTTTFRWNNTNKRLTLVGSTTLELDNTDVVASSNEIQFSLLGSSTALIAKRNYSEACSDLSGTCTSVPISMEFSDADRFLVNSDGRVVASPTGTRKNKYSSVVGGSLIVGGTSGFNYTDVQNIGDGNLFVNSGVIASTMVVSPSGNIGVSIGTNAVTTNSGVMFDVSASTSNGVVVFNNQAQTVGSANSMMTLISTNTAYAGYFMRIFRNDSNSNGDIRFDSPNPNLEFVETDQDNAKFEVGINNGISYWATRNSANDSFERVFNVPSIKSGAPGITILSTGSLKLSDTAGSTIGFKAPNTLGASWTHDLWSTSSNSGKVLIQTSDGGSRPLAWSNTYGVASSSLTNLAPTEFKGGVTFSSSVVVSGAGNGEIDLTKSDGLYKVISSSVAWSAGQCAVGSSSQTVIWGTCGSGGGVGDAVLAATQTFKGTNYFGREIYVSTNVGGARNVFINTVSSTNLTGNNNIMIGSGNSPTTGSNITTGSSNVCIGNASCTKIWNESSLVAVGPSALQNSSGTTNNTAFGSLAGQNTTQGSQITAIGRGALFNNTTGSFGTALGYNACVNTSAEAALDNVMCLGAESRVDTSGTMAIGSTARPITDVYMNSINPGLGTNGLPITFHAQNSSGTNATGGNFTIAAGQGSGSGNGGKIDFRVAKAGASGATQNSLATALTIHSSGTIQAFGGVNFSSAVLLSGSAGTSGQVLTSAGTGAAPTWSTASGSESTRCTVEASGDTIGLFVGASVSDPCNISFAGTIRAITSSSTFVATGGSGADTVRVQVLQAGTVNVLSASRTGTCTGCTASVGTAFTDAPIWEWTITNTTFDVGGGTRRIADAGETPVTGGTGISVVKAAGGYTVSLAGSSSSDFMDMGYWQFHFLPYVHANTGTFVPFTTYCEASASGVGVAESLVAGEPRGYNYFTGGTPADGDYLTCSMGGDAAAPSARPRFSDFVGTFKAFEIGASMRVSTTTSIVSRFGVFGSDVDHTPADFIGIVLDSSVDTNWRCQICTTADGCSSGGTTVAASTSSITVKLAATTTGNLSCTINSTEMTHSDTFPTFATGTNVAASVRTRTAASRSFDLYEVKGRVAR